jgi:hypothetical protein
MCLHKGLNESTPQEVMHLFVKPRTLIFAIASLNFLVFAFLYFTFQDAGALWFVETRDFENLRSVEPRIGAAAHDCDAFTHPA